MDSHGKGSPFHYIGNISAIKNNLVTVEGDALRPAAQKFRIEKDTWLMDEADFSQFKIAETFKVGDKVDVSYAREETGSRIITALQITFADSNKAEAWRKAHLTAKLLPRDTRAKDVANVFWKKQFQLYDFVTDAPIMPKIVKGSKVYTIYYASNEDKQPRRGIFTESELEKLLRYKFIDQASCEKFCSGR